MVERQAHEEQTRVSAQQAAEKSRQEALECENMASIREREYRQVEQVVGQVLTQNHRIYDVDCFIQAVEQARISVRYPQKGKLVFQLAGSSHTFNDKDLKPGGQEFKVLFGEQVQANKQQWHREQARERSNDREMGD